MGWSAALDCRAAASQRGCAHEEEAAGIVNIDRILTVVGDVPADLDRDELRSDLEGVRSIYRTGVSLRQAPSKRLQKVNKIVEAAERLELLIMGEPHLGRHRPALKRLVADAKQELFPSELVKLLGGGGQVSAFQNLIDILRDTFERHFKIEAGYTRDPINDVVTGAFIDFAQAALEEMNVTYLGRPYSRGSIASALSDVKKQIRA
jgi:hypothetical protein